MTDSCIMLHNKHNKKKKEETKVIILGINIDTRCNESCPFMYISHKDICPLCKYFVPIDPIIILKDLQKLKTEYEKGGRIITNVIVKGNNIINICSEVI